MKCQVWVDGQSGECEYDVSNVYVRHCACIQAENCAGSEGEQIRGHHRWWDLRDVVWLRVCSVVRMIVGGSNPLFWWHAFWRFVASKIKAAHMLLWTGPEFTLNLPGVLERNRAHDTQMLYISALTALCFSLRKTDPSSMVYHLSSIQWCNRGERKVCQSWVLQWGVGDFIPWHCCCFWVWL
jgi:hypothetical protein